MNASIKSMMAAGLLLSLSSAAVAEELVAMDASISQVTIGFSEAQMETVLTQSGKLSNFNTALTDSLAPASAVVAAVPCMNANTAAASLVRSLVMRDVARMDASLSTTAYVAQVPTYTALEKKKMFKSQIATLYPHSAIAHLSAELISLVEPLVGSLGLTRDDFVPGILNSRPVCRVKVGSDTKTIRSFSYFDTPCAWLGMPAAKPASSEATLDTAVAAGAGGCNSIAIKKAASLALSQVVASDVIVQPMSSAQDFIMTATMVQTSIKQAKDTMVLMEAASSEALAPAASY